MEEKTSLDKKIIEDTKQIMYGEVDWIKVLKDAYESRKTSWFEIGHIKEWRNCTDEILFAVWHQLEPKLKERVEIDIRTLIQPCLKELKSKMMGNIDKYGSFCIFHFEKVLDNSFKKHFGKLADVQEVGEK